MLKGVKLLQEAGNEKPISLKELRKLKKEKEGAEEKNSKSTGAGEASSAAGQERDSQ
jgi:mevalonate kinase